MVKVTTCQNGVRIVSEHIPYTRSISLGIWVDAGSRYELPEENGITHFIEHMLFKGTTNRTAKQIAESFDPLVEKSMRLRQKSIHATMQKY